MSIDQVVERLCHTDRLVYAALLADGHKTLAAEFAALHSIPAQVSEGAIEALERIASGSFPNASTLATEGRWQEAFNELQRIAYGYLVMSAKGDGR